jgi:hypothetical protein
MHRSGFGCPFLSSAGYTVGGTIVMPPVERSSTNFSPVTGSLKSVDAFAGGSSTTYQ